MLMQNKSILKKILNFCTGSGWNVTAGDIGSCSWFVTELLITYKCFGYCWAELVQHQIQCLYSTLPLCWEGEGDWEETGRKCRHSCRPELPKGIFHAHLLNCLILTHKFACFLSSSALPRPTGNDGVALLCSAASRGQPNTLLF